MTVRTDIGTTAASIAGRAGTCTICGAETRAPAAGPDVVCESAHCRVLLGRRAHMSPDAFRFVVGMRRRQRRDLAEHAEAQRLRLAERREREALEHEAIRDAACREQDLPASSYPLLVLPSGPRAFEPLTPQRRQRYREHLAAIIAEAGCGEDGDAAIAETPAIDAAPPMPLATQLCTLCRGGCCSGGHDRAYLTAATIRRFMRLRPELRPDEIAEAYLDRLGDQTVAGSCINHGGTGCSLPREMRSDTCNDYFCNPMRAWQARCASGEPPRGAFVIQRRLDNWNRDRLDAANDIVDVSVVTETGSRPLKFGRLPPVVGSETSGR